MAVKDRLADVPVLGTALRMQERYKDDDADQFAAAIGFFGFLSIFPLLLIAASVAGFVLRDDPQAQAGFVRTAFDAIPGITAALGAGDGDRSQLDVIVRQIVENAGTIGLVGAVTLVVSGLRVVNAGMTATLRAFHVDVEMGGVQLKLRQVVAVVTLGTLALAGAAATAALGVAVRVDVSSVGSALATVATVLISIALDFLLFVVAYRLLAVGKGPGFRRVWSGALLAAVAWTGLKAFGATYVSGQVSRANELYGTLGGVIALLLLLYLAGRIYLYGAELSAVLHAPGGELVARTADDLPDAGDGTLPPARPAPAVGAQRRPGSRGGDVRGALAFLIALGTVGGLVRLTRPWETD